MERITLFSLSFSFWLDEESAHDFDPLMVCQNVMLIDRSALFGDSDDEEADELEDMRLDVDNMSYEVRI